MSVLDLIIIGQYSPDIEPLTNLRALFLLKTSKR
jgi:hypothetical protein